MLLHVDVKPELLRWARERADATLDDLRAGFPKLEAWELGDAKPTLKQLERFAKATCAPIGFFFLAAPPKESIPIPDLRTIGNVRIARPSPNLLDTIYVCEQRQSWYRDHALATGAGPLSFVGSARLGAPPETIAPMIREAVGFTLDEQQACPTWSDALRTFIQRVDGAGILVMCSGVVLNNTNRRLDPTEFRGFAMADGMAPVVFLNGADSRAAQMFTLAHELAHVWLGQSALSDSDASSVPTERTERWCNRVAAELLVPLSVLRADLPSGEPTHIVVQRLAARFKVSSLVVLRRIHDAGRISATEFRAAYSAELSRIEARPKGSGGNFYLTQTARVSQRFARALIESTLEGHTLYRDAFRMLGIKKAVTFEAYAESMGYTV